MSLRVLFFADIFGRPGRKAIAASLPDLVEEHKPDFVFANAENLAGGRGVSHKTFNELMRLGFDGFTTGNHVWDNRDVFGLLESDPRLLRPENFPSPPASPCPGKGHHVYESKDGKKLRIINLIGRVFMADVDCPFQAVDRILAEEDRRIPTIVDMHADATSEKTAMGWHLAGRVSAVIGSHSHVQTADERILPGGTAYITDIGMSGSFDSCIGLKPREVIDRFMTKRPYPYSPATENLGIGCVVIDIGVDGKAVSIERIRRTGLLGLGYENPSDVD